MIERILSFFGPGLQIRCPVGFYPSRGTKESAGLDLSCTNRVVIRPGETVKVPVGIQTYFRPGWVAKIHDRSSLGSRGIHVFGGIIDSDYRGEWQVLLYNSTTETVRLAPGLRIAQALFHRVWTGKPLNVAILPDSDSRGDAGFGSTGN